MTRTKELERLNSIREENEILKQSSERIVGKLGSRNIKLHNVPQLSWNYLRDFVTTLIDGKWRYTLTAFGMSYLSTWTMFALLYMLISWEHGDFDYDPITGARLGRGKLQCIINAHGFVGFFIMSVDAQTTIGFGEKYPSEECPQGVYLLALQMMLAVGIEGAMISIVYAKLTRPPRRTREYKFSRNAVICMRDGKLSLVFRIDDADRNHVIGTKVEAILFTPKLSQEGEEIRKFQYSLPLENNGQVSLLWPQTIAHVIDARSQLYDLSPDDLYDRKFEIVLTLTGSSRTTGQTTQARTSYVAKDIFWGQRFVNIIYDDDDKAEYIADYNRFDTTETVVTPRLSASQIDSASIAVASCMDEVRDVSGGECSKNCK